MNSVSVRRVRQGRVGAGSVEVEGYIMGGPREMPCKNMSKKGRGGIRFRSKPHSQGRCEMALQAADRHEPAPAP